MALGLRLMAVVVIVCLTGCILSAPQVESTWQFFKNLHPSGNDVPEPQAPLWLASVGARGATLYPYVADELTVFANSDGDAISFDGWTIRSIVGFGLNTPVSVFGRSGSRKFVIEGKIMEETCGPWTWTPPSWRQICSNGDGEILLSEDGSIEAITMSLHEAFGRVTLRLVDSELKMQVSGKGNIDE